MAWRKGASVYIEITRSVKILDMLYTVCVCNVFTVWEKLFPEAYETTSHADPMGVQGNLFSVFHLQVSPDLIPLDVIIKDVVLVIEQHHYARPL